MEDEIQSGEEAAEERESALVPEALFGPNCEVGKTYSVKVVGKYDGDVEIEHVEKKEDNKDDYSMRDAEMELDGAASNEM